jgi:hypothetical protein
MTIEILVAPNLRTSWIKVVKRLEKGDYDMLFLNFPKNLEDLIVELAYDKLPSQDLIEEVRDKGLLPEPIGAWSYTAEPLLEFLAGIKYDKPYLEIRCYKDPNYTRIFADTASEIASLAFEARVTNKIKVEDWKLVLAKRIDRKLEALDSEAELIGANTIGDCACLSGLDGRGLEIRLVEHDVKLVYIDEWYHPTPLQILEEKLAKGDVPYEEAEKLIKGHLEFVDYVLKSEDRDQAYYRWAYDKIPSIRRKIDFGEIEHPSIP